METRKLKCERISGTNFSKYGTYVSAAKRSPNADNGELKFWNKLGLMNLSGTASVSIVQTYGKNGLIERTLERHLSSTETLIPTEDVIIVVALADSASLDVPDFSSVKAFHVEKGCAVILGKNTWHHAPLTSREIVNTFVIFDESTPDRDCYAIDLPQKYGLEYEVEP